MNEINLYSLICFQFDWEQYADGFAWGCEVSEGCWKKTTRQYQNSVSFRVDREAVQIHSGGNHSQLAAENEVHGVAKRALFGTGEDYWQDIGKNNR